MKISRREWLKGVGAASSAALFGGAWRQAPERFAQSSLPSLPAPASCGIEHIVVVTMENRSFDHFLGWLQNGSGKQAGLTFVDKTGQTHQTHSLARDFTGCPHPSPDHSYAGGRVEYNHGAMDGFLRAGSNDVYSIGFYGEADIPFFGALARN